MTDSQVTAYPTDEQFTSHFFSVHDVRLSVELAERCQNVAVDARSELPSFFCWQDGQALYLVDFNDGFSAPLAGRIDAALALIAAAGVAIEGLRVHWRDEAKAWHTLAAGQVAECFIDPVGAPVAA